MEQIYAVQYAVHPGKDVNVRVADVRTESTNYRRPIHRLWLIEESSTPVQFVGGENVPAKTAMEIPPKLTAHLPHIVSLAPAWTSEVSSEAWSYAAGGELYRTCVRACQFSVCLYRNRVIISRLSNTVSTFLTYGPLGSTEQRISVKTVFNAFLLRRSIACFCQIQCHSSTTS